MPQTLRRDRELVLSRLKYEMAAYRFRLSMLAAYETAKATGAGRDAIVASMRAVIQHQVEQDVYISSHLTDRAIDIAIRDSSHRALTLENLNALFLSIHKHGGRILDEHEPPHIHVQF